MRQASQAGRWAARQTTKGERDAEKFLHAVVFDVVHSVRSGRSCSVVFKPRRQDCSGDGNGPQHGDWPAFCHGCGGHNRHHQPDAIRLLHSMRCVTAGLPRPFIVEAVHAASLLRALTHACWMRSLSAGFGKLSSWVRTRSDRYARGAISTITRSSRCAYFSTNRLNTSRCGGSISRNSPEYSTSLPSR